MSKPKTYMTIDVETTGKDWTTCILHGLSVGFSTSEQQSGEAHYYAADEIPFFIRAQLADPAIPKIGAGMRYDCKVLKRHGYEVKGELHDIQVIWNLVDTNLDSLGLKELSEQKLGIDTLEAKHALDQYCSRNKVNHVGQLCALDLATTGRPHFPIISEYGIEDNLNTTSLFWMGTGELKALDTRVKALGFKKGPMDYYFAEALPIETVLLAMEYRGLQINLAEIEKVRAEHVAAAAALEAQMNAVMVNRIPRVEQGLAATKIATLVQPQAIAKVIAGEGKYQFKWSNSNHAALLFYQHCGLPEELILTTNKGKYCTDKEAIATLYRNVESKKLQAVLEQYREYKLHQKMISTYTGDEGKGIMSKVRWVTPDGKIHLNRQPNAIPRIFPQYRQTTDTGRFAASNPNMQNLQRNSGVKRFFIPDLLIINGKVVKQVVDDADYSQIELRAAAHLSNDVAMLRAYRNKEDLHCQTATVLFGRPITKKDDAERQAGKETNFLTIFKGGAWRLQDTLLKKTKKEYSKEQCQEFLDKWFEAYPGVAQYLDDQLAFFEKHGFCITETGRVRLLPDIRYGKYLVWNKGTVKGKITYIPSFTGPEDMRSILLRDLYAANRHRPYYVPSESDIGWAARKRYNHAIKAGYNQPIQGLAASMTKRAMIKLHAMGKTIMNQVHDNLSVARPEDKPEEVKILVDTMAAIYPLKVPVEADVKTLTSLHPEDKYEPQQLSA